MAKTHESVRGRGLGNDQLVVDRMRSSGQLRRANFVG